MTRQPWTIERGASLNVAHKVMRSHAIRPDADPDEVTVDEAMTETVYVAAPGDNTADVVERMASSKLGSVVVMRDADVEGIFASIDALQVLSSVLRRAAGED